MAARKKKAEAAKPATSAAPAASSLERDMATLNDRLQKVIYQLELRLPGQARFVDLATANFAHEVLTIIRGGP